MHTTTRGEFPNLRTNPQKLYDSFKGPAALITKHNKKAVDYARYNALKAKDESPDKKLVESAKTFQSLHESLLEELPIFLSLTCEFVEAIVNQFSIAQSGIVLIEVTNCSVVSSMDGRTIKTNKRPFHSGAKIYRCVRGNRC
jgi:hypothetical protein